MTNSISIKCLPLGKELNDLVEFLKTCRDNDINSSLTVFSNNDKFHTETGKNLPEHAMRYSIAYKGSSAMCENINKYLKERGLK